MSTELFFTKTFKGGLTQEIEDLHGEFLKSQLSAKMLLA